MPRVCVERNVAAPNLIVTPPSYSYVSRAVVDFFQGPRFDFRLAHRMGLWVKGPSVKTTEREHSRNAPAKGTYIPIIFLPYSWGSLSGGSR